MTGEIEKLTKTLLNQPVKVEVTPVSSTAGSVGQSVYFVNKANKAKLLLHLLKDPNIVSALIFTKTKHGANKLAETLRDAGENLRGHSRQQKPVGPPARPEPV